MPVALTQQHCTLKTTVHLQRMLCIHRQHQSHTAFVTATQSCTSLIPKAPAHTRPHTARTCKGKYGMDCGPMHECTFESKLSSQLLQVVGFLGDRRWWCRPRCLSLAVAPHLPRSTRGVSLLRWAVATRQVEGGRADGSTLEPHFKLKSGFKQIRLIHKFERHMANCVASHRF
jgi:hypothetical protein